MKIIYLKKDSKLIQLGFIKYIEERFHDGRLRTFFYYDFDMVKYFTSNHSFEEIKELIWEAQHGDEKQNESTI